MDHTTKLELIRSLLAELEKLRSASNVRAREYQIFHTRAEMIVRVTCGEKSKYLMKLNTNSLFSIRPNVNLDHINARDYYGPHNELVTLLKTIEEETILTLDQSDDEQTNQKPKSNKIFVVHGHDESMKQATARILEKLGLEPIILHEKPNQGRAIIEKFANYADVSFAVILLSPDDMGYSKHETYKKSKPRSRQNVILELGYFLGKLGRGRVTALHLPEENFEIPSDYSGVLFILFDAAGQWKFDLVKELQASGFDVDANKLI